MLERYSQLGGFSPDTGFVCVTRLAISSSNNWLWDGCGLITNPDPLVSNSPAGVIKISRAIVSDVTVVPYTVLFQLKGSVRSFSCVVYAAPILVNQSGDKISHLIPSPWSSVEFIVIRLLFSVSILKRTLFAVFSRV